MKIIYKQGDLLEADECIIAHGCNAKGVMGSGVALAIKKKWPEAYIRYKDYYDRFGLTVGMNQWAYCPDKLIINCITQETYGRGKAQYVDYDAIRSCMKRINDMTYRSALVGTMLMVQKDRIPRAATVKIEKIMSGQAWPQVYKILAEDAPEFSIPKIAMPKIGAGLGNGDWNIIEKIIQYELTEVQPVVYVKE